MDTEVRLVEARRAASTAADERISEEFRAVAKVNEGLVNGL